MQSISTLVLVQEQWEPRGLATEFRQVVILVLARVLAPAYVPGTRVPEMTTAEL